VQTCPVPLPTWLADSGGKGIQLIPVTHGEAQLRSRWQKDGAQVVLDTCGVKIWLPGISDTGTLKMASDLCGQAAVRERGQDHHTRHEAMTPDMIRQLPAGHALIVRGGYAPVVARLGAAWKDRAYKTARRRGAAIAALTPAPAAPGGTPAFGTGSARPPRLTIVPDSEAETGPDDPGDSAYPWS
jgi:type IV secretion system protein VirD4